MIFLHRLVIISGETPLTPPSLRCPQTGSTDPKLATLLILLIIASQHASSSAIKLQKQFRTTLYVLYCNALLSIVLENVPQTDPTLPIAKIGKRTLKNTNSRTKAKKRYKAAIRMHSLASNSTNKLHCITFSPPFLWLKKASTWTTIPARAFFTTPSPYIPHYIRPWQQYAAFPAGSS